jgi:hypothetical protein
MDALRPKTASDPAMTPAMDDAPALNSAETRRETAPATHTTAPLGGQGPGSVRYGQLSQGVRRVVSSGLTPLKLQLERLTRPPAQQINNIYELAEAVQTQIYFEGATVQVQEAYVGALKERLALQPRRTLDDETSQRFLATHDVFVSLTTSPQRIGKVHHVLETLDLSHVKEVLIALPERYGRDGTTYDIPPELLQMPKVRILRTEKDYGPATKLLPAAEYAREAEKPSIVITVDDDIGYPRGAINELIFASAHNPNTAISASGSNLEVWGIAGRASEGGPEFSAAEGSDASLRPVDVVEGFGSIAYPVARLNIEEIKAWTARSKSCMLSDDLVISMSLRNSGVERVRMQSPYLNKDQLRPFPYGFGKDALHHGAGTGTLEPHMNHKKYQAAFAELLEQIKA